MRQISQKSVTKVAFQQAYQMKLLMIKKIQFAIDHEADVKRLGIFQRMIREEHNHLDILEKKIDQLRLE